AAAGPGNRTSGRASPPGARRSIPVGPPAPPPAGSRRTASPASVAAGSAAPSASTLTSPPSSGTESTADPTASPAPVWLLAQTRRSPTTAGPEASSSGRPPAPADASSDRTSRAGAAPASGDARKNRQRGSPTPVSEVSSQSTAVSV